MFIIVTTTCQYTLGIKRHAALLSPEFPTPSLYLFKALAIDLNPPLLCHQLCQVHRKPKGIPQEKGLVATDHAVILRDSVVCKRPEALDALGQGAAKGLLLVCGAKQTYAHTHIHTYKMRGGTETKLATRSSAATADLE